MATISIRRLIRDVSCPDSDKRMLAMNTVLRLNKENVDQTDGYHELAAKLEDLGNSGTTPEEIDQARKGWNHLREMAPKFRLPPVTARQSVVAAGGGLDAQGVVTMLSQTQD